MFVALSFSDDIPLGDTHLLEEHDLETVLNSLPEDAFKELFTTGMNDSFFLKNSKRRYSFNIVRIKKTLFNVHIYSPSG